MWLDSQKSRFDVLYLDPARRDVRGLKVSSLKACETEVESGMGKSVIQG